MKDGYASDPVITAGRNLLLVVSAAASRALARTKTPTHTLQNNIPALTKHLHISFVAHVGLDGRAMGEGGAPQLRVCGILTGFL